MQTTENSVRGLRRAATEHRPGSGRFRCPSGGESLLCRRTSGTHAGGRQGAAEPLHPCVQPRRRFVLRFLGVCASLVLLGSLVWGSRAFAAGDREFLHLWLVPLFGVYMLLMVTPAALLLLIPARTKRGSLLQLIGLVVPLLVAGMACALCWGNPTDGVHARAFGMATIVLSWGGALTFHVPGLLLNVVLAALTKRKTA